MIAIVLAGVSFVGYALVKYFGAATAFCWRRPAGGLASSTAVTARQCAPRRCGRGRAARCWRPASRSPIAVSFARVIAIVAVLNPRLLRAIAPPLIAATLVAVGLAVAAVYWRRNPADEQKAVEFRNPFGVWSVIGFAPALGRDHRRRARARRAGRARPEPSSARPRIGPGRRRRRHGVDGAACAAARSAR